MVTWIEVEAKPGLSVQQMRVLWTHGETFRDRNSFTAVHQGVALYRGYGVLVTDQDGDICTLHDPAWVLV